MSFSRKERKGRKERKMAMKKMMMALGCAAVTMFAGCMCDRMAARDLQPKEAVECPEIRSEYFSLLFENIATNRIELCGQRGISGSKCGQRGISGSKEVDELAVRDAVREAIEGCGRFGKEKPIEKRDGGLQIDVRIIEQQWHSDGEKYRPTVYLQIGVEVVTHIPLNNFSGYYASRNIGRGTVRIYVSWGTPSMCPIDGERYNDGVASAVQQALRDLHPFPERMTMRGDRPIAWKDIGSLSDAKKVEERYTTSVPPHLSPLGGLVPDIDIYKRMKEIRLASVSFRPPATLMDAVLFFQSASVPYDGSGEVILFAMRPAKTDEIYPPAPELTAEDISFYDALKIVVESANARFWIRGDGVVVVEPKSWTCDDGCKPGDAWLLDEGSWPKTGDGESMGVSQNLKEGN